MNIIHFQRQPQNEITQAFDRLASLRDEMDRLFDTSFGGSLWRSPASLRNWSPALDVYQDKDHFTVVAEIPGIKKEDIDITLHEGTLTISGERKAETNGQQGFRRERFVGRFQRSVTLPTAIHPDGVKASYTDGVLKVVLPKAEEAKPKQIEVSVS